MLIQILPKSYTILNINVNLNNISNDKGVVLAQTTLANNKSKPAIVYQEIPYAFERQLNVTIENKDTFHKIINQLYVRVVRNDTADINLRNFRVGRLQSYENVKVCDKMKKTFQVVPNKV